MIHIGNVGARTLGAAAAPDAPVEGADSTYVPTPEEVAFARQHPAGMVHVERSGLKLATRITGGTLGLGGAALLGISLLSRGAGGASRLLAAPLIIGGGLIAAGAGAAIGAELIKPRQEVAVATKFTTRADAQQFANKMVGRVAQIVEDEGGTFAVLDRGPIQNTRGYDYGRDTYYGNGRYDGYHYYGDGHYHPPNYFEPYYPGHYHPDYYPDYNWGSGYDPWNSYPTPSGGSTNSGDDGGGSTWNPPSYNPPAYDPPSYDPPSYGGGSDYGGGYGGDSSSNGNPSADDF